MKSRIYLIISILVLISCKKAEERKCFKGHGEYTEHEVSLDSVDKFNLYKNIKYRLIEDSTRKVVLKGGENMLNNILVEEVYEEDKRIVNIRNNNKCNFLRKSDQVIEAEIHYPYFSEIYAEPTDSIIAMNTLHGNSLRIELREGGGSAVLDVDVVWFYIVASFGTVDYTVNGQSDHATIKVQNNGFCDVTNFSSLDMFLYQNSTGDLKCNLEGSDAEILLEGTGNVLYMGEPQSIELSRHGSGEVIKL